jgi:hypothetical protein
MFSVCGVYNYKHYSAVETETIADMLQLIRPWAPDDEGLHVDDSFT